MFTVADSSSVQDAAKAVTESAVATVADTVQNTGFTAKVTLGQVIEFQMTGLLVVFTVLGGLTLMLYLMAWLLKTIVPDQYYGKSRPAPAAPATVPAKPGPAAAATAASAAPPSVSIHPGLSDEELLAILAVAASEGMGQSVIVVKFRPMDSMDWTWSVQGRVGLHSSRRL